MFQPGLSIADKQTRTEQTTSALPILRLFLKKGRDGPVLAGQRLLDRGRNFPDTGRYPRCRERLAPDAGKSGWLIAAVGEMALPTWSSRQAQVGKRESGHLSPTGLCSRVPGTAWTSHR